jgi:N-acyl-D-aspartate/D-glutamate deacylase
MTDADVVIRSGTIHDGSGRPGFKADLAICGSLVTAIGQNLPKGREEIDASGLLVTPGFVDIHTHYDGQATWENSLRPSSQHGVTTVVAGNCGVGFAPCRPDDRETMIRVMEGVEDIPDIVMAAGLPWNWETFPDYLDALAARELDIDIAVHVPHSPLRVYVMGERRARREAATGEDLATMRRLEREAVEAGAIGVSTSRLQYHRARSGDLVPSVESADAELLALSGGLRDAGRGVFQIIPDVDDAPAEEMRLMRDRC